jgi:hypothetical protein
MKSEIIEAKIFLETWIKVVDKRKEHLLRIWKEAKNFTKEVKENEDSILNEIASELGLKCSNGDYYFIDSVLYKDEDWVLKNGFYLSNIRVAFEHENYVGSGLYKEATHLVITNCDLRVLVAYPNNDEKELNQLHEIIKANRLSKQFSEEESFLVIFGEEKTFEWSGYVFKNEDWKKINNINE